MPFKVLGCDNSTHIYRQYEICLFIFNNRQFVYLRIIYIYHRARATLELYYIYRIYHPHAKCELENCWAAIKKFLINFFPCIYILYTGIYSAAFTSATSCLEFFRGYLYPHTYLYTRKLSGEKVVFFWGV